MASVNRVILVGNVGKDPEVRYLPSGQAVASFSVATTLRRKDKEPVTEWHRIVLYDRLAEIAGEYVKKGKPVYIEGRIKYGKYTDQQGNEKHTVDIVGHELQLLGGRDDADKATPTHHPNGAPVSPAPRQALGPGGGGSGFDDMDDDIPFATSSMRYDMTTSKQRKMARYG